MRDFVPSFLSFSISLRTMKRAYGRTRAPEVFVLKIAGHGSALLVQPVLREPDSTLGLEG